MMLYVRREGNVDACADVRLLPRIHRLVSNKKTSSHTAGLNANNMKQTNTGDTVSFVTVYTLNHGERTLGRSKIVSPRFQIFHSIRVD